jgi:NTE family protein
MDMNRTEGRRALALQGGGAHGAFAWGVVDRLLEDGVRIDAVCGVSSGAILAVMLAQGLARGGPEAARAEMRRLWSRIGRMQALQPWLGGWEMLWGGELMWQGLETALRLFSPTQLNPLGHNPLRELLAALVDRDLLNAPGAPRVTVAATDVESGRAVMFDNAAIDVDILLASSCLPYVFPAVEIGGRAFWDGAYAGNPPLGPLLVPVPEEILLVRSLPVRRPGVPRSASEIFNRMQEIACQTVLDAEIATLPEGIRLVTYDADATLVELPASTKVQASEALLERLFAAGRAVTPTSSRRV